MLSFAMKRQLLSGSCSKEKHYGVIRRFMTSEHAYVVLHDTICYTLLPKKASRPKRLIKSEMRVLICVLPTTKSTFLPIFLHAYAMTDFDIHAHQLFVT